MAKKKKAQPVDETPEIKASELNEVCALVRKNEQDYINGITRVSKYVEISMYENLNRIDAYVNSKHITGDVDSLGRDKPFFNIVTAAVNVWFRATYIDPNNIQIKATKNSQVLEAFLATAHLQNWMTREKFYRFLNKWSRNLAKYGSAVTKFVEKNGKLHAISVPWNRLIVDTIDFYANPVIEVLELTPAQLRKNKLYDQVKVEDLIESAAKARTLTDGEQKDNKTGYIKIYEVHGELPLSYITDAPEDDDIYRQQMQVISFVASDKENEFQDFVLFKGVEKKNPYMITHLLEEDDQTLSIGAVQNLFDPQWMVNHSAKSIKDQLDLASKIIYQTADTRFVGQNALAAIEMGDILIHADNKPITQVSAQTIEVTQHQSFIQTWQTLGNQINGISEAMLGIRGRSVQSARQTQALLTESYALFEVMTESKIMHLEDMMREFILPFVKKQMDTSSEIAATLDSYGLNKIDSMFIPAEAVRRHNAKAKEAVLNGDVPPVFDQQAGEAQVRSELSQQGNQRFFKPSDIPDRTWKQLFKELEWEIGIEVTRGMKDKQAVMDTLNTVLKLLTSATPEQLADPNFKMVFNKILEQMAVISPLELAAAPQAQPPKPTNKVAESMSYKDTPDDVKRQIEQQAGLEPSKIQTQVQQPNAVVQPVQ